MNTKRPGLSKTALATAAIALAGLPTHAHAQWAPPITIETVTVGDINNPGDTAIMTVGNLGEGMPGYGSTGYGSVGYEYQIGKYEVTNAQYVAFLNDVGVNPTNNSTLGLYNGNMDGVPGGITWNGSSNKYEVKAGVDANGSSYANMPVNWVSFWDAARFTNWLTTGTTETGVYNLEGNSAIPSNPDVTRTLDQIPGTLWAVASENEWYKAAYYNGNGSYRTYPVTGTLSQTTANYRDSAFPDPYLTEVDHYDSVDGANSFYGTFQQAGNMMEWNDGGPVVGGSWLRGGWYLQFDEFTASSARVLLSSEVDPVYGGFRVVALSSLAVPEPSTYALLGGVGALALAVLRGRRRKQ